MPAKRPLQLISFDVDDTLYPTSEFVGLARDQSLKAMLAAGLKLSPEDARAELNEVVQEFTSNDEHHFDRLLTRIPKECLDGINPIILVATGVAAYHDAVFHYLAPYEDVQDVIRKLNEAGFRLGISSEGLTVKQAQKLVRLKLLNFLDRRALFFSQQLGMSKSNPKFFQRAAESLGLNPERCMHVGDRPDRDVDSANQAGWITVLNCRSGRYHERPGATPPAYTIHNFWDLQELVDREFEPAPGD
jgi:putative hydrolase of the HAD superfamily